MGSFVLDAFICKLTVWLLHVFICTKSDNSTYTNNDVRYKVSDSLELNNGRFTGQQSRNLVVSDVKILLKLNPTDMRTQSLDESVRLDVQSLLSQKGVYMYNDTRLLSYYNQYTNFLQLVRPSYIVLK